MRCCAVHVTYLLRLLSFTHFPFRISKCLFDSKNTLTTCRPSHLSLILFHPRCAIILLTCKTPTTHQNPEKEKFNRLNLKRLFLRR
ncbi:hypothetical protein L1987_28486 [Smallanthus sonchifolius]|uniref:Uncharacterized protein n=1 Tax=Smallanthus sonchifolius TaxID=185202 RepID=A0ACB9HYU2_9ASTR|nr:hypothetical protein L1987_28486 [Smallanthus sonchifolius]